MFAYKKFFENETNDQKFSEYDQVITHSHTADQHMAPWGRASEHL